VEGKPESSRRERGSREDFSFRRGSFLGEKNVALGVLDREKNKWKRGIARKKWQGVPQKRAIPSETAGLWRRLTSSEVSGKGAKGREGSEKERAGKVKRVREGFQLLRKTGLVGEQRSLSGPRKTAEGKKGPKKKWRRCRGGGTVSFVNFA